MGTEAWLRWALGLSIAVMVVGVPIVHYRYEYTQHKRLREVKPGVFYRSGQMTEQGFLDAIRHHGIRTIINAQDEFADPDLMKSPWDPRTVKESELCQAAGVRYVHLAPDLLPRGRIPTQRPQAIDRFLAIMDDKANHPVLIHCHAGLHRTGVLSAVYRMEYDGWTSQEAIRELKANGFGEFPCSSANDYITQYVLTYRRGIREGGLRAEVGSRR